MFLSAITPTSFTVVDPSEEVNLDARSGHRSVSDHQFLYSWGGYNPEYWEQHDENTSETRYPLFRELWRYEFTTKEWKQLQISGNVPEGLASHTIVKLNDHILHIGGSGVPFGHSNSNAVYDLDLTTLEWKRLVPEVNDWFERGAPKPKYGQSLTLVGQYLYHVGGTSGFTYDMEVNRLDLASLTWEHMQVESKHLPEPRYRHDTVHFRGKLYVFGGGTAHLEQPLDKVDVFDIESRKWELVQTVPYHDPSTKKDSFPAPRKCHSCHVFHEVKVYECWTPGGRSKDVKPTTTAYVDPISSAELSFLASSLTSATKDVYVIGGLNEEVIESVIWKLHIPSLQWTRLDHLVLPQPVYFHSSNVSKEGCLTVFGGCIEVDVERTNSLQCVWLTVPSLKTMCRSAVWNCLDISQLRRNREQLLHLGVPSQYLDVT